MIMSGRSAKPAAGDVKAKLLRSSLQETHSESELEDLLRRFSEGARRGDPRYKYALGEWMVSGVDPVLTANPKKGLQLLKQAAAAGVVEAAFAVGVCLRNGIGCQVDKNGAVEWYHRAALLGSTDAMGELAKIYFRGEIVSKNVKLAKAWQDAANKIIEPIFYYGPGAYTESVRSATQRLKTKR